MNSKRLETAENKRENLIFSFGEFSFDAAEKILWRGAEIVQIPPKSREVLGVLLENAERVLSKEDLMNLVWQDTFVEEANLSHHIAVLRKTLGDDKNGKRFIETIPRKGYRFVADLKHANDETAEIIIHEKTRTEIVEKAFIESDDLAEKKNKELRGRENNRWFWTASGTFILILLAIGSFFAWRNFGTVKTDEPKTEVKIKRLTPDEDAYAPSISPDGESVVFGKLFNGQETLWRKKLQTGEMTQLLPALSVGDEWGIVYTRFSPDGKWVYYKKEFPDFNAAAVYRIGANGGAPQKIAENVQTDFSISPDGKQIAFMRDYRFLIVVDIESGAERVAAERNGDNQVIHSRWLNSAAWSPDGKRLVFCAGIAEENRYVRQLWEVNLTTGAESRIPAPEDFPVAFQIEWLPDASGLIFTQMPDDTNVQIWRIAYPSGEMRRITNETDDYRDMRLSADGKKIVAQKSLGNFNLWTAPIDNFAQKRQITIGAAAQHFGATFTRDGKIIYSSAVSGASNLWMIDSDGDNPKQLTVNAGKINSFPEVTSDGHYLVFNSSRSGTQQVWRADADGRNPVQLSRAVEAWRFSLSPENEIYYFAAIRRAAKNSFQLFKVPVAGGEQSEVNDFYYQLPPWFSPDGKWMIVWGSLKADEKPRFALVERASGKIVRYFDKMIETLRWMPDSKAVIYHNAQSLMKQPIEGGEPQKFIEFRPNRLSDFSFSADGKQMVFSLGNSTNEVVLIENFNSGGDAK